VTPRSSLRRHASSTHHGIAPIAPASLGASTTHTHHTAASPRNDKELTMLSRTALPIAALTLLASGASAGLSITWFSIDGGGTQNVSAGAYTLSSSVGQHDATNTATTGAFAFTGGYQAGAIVTCPADFDGSGFVDTDDFTAFVLAFEAGTDDADFDGTGFVDTDDFTAFVLAFESGC
jgi:hypothetical protein